MIRPIAEFMRPDAASLWQVVNDDVMGGRSVSRVGAGPTGALVFSGELSLANGGGFASMRSLPGDLALGPRDVIVATVKGDGRDYLLNLYTLGAPMAFSHRVRFTTGAGTRQTVRFPLAEFKATRFGTPVSAPPAAEAGPVVSVGFMLADGKAGPFSLEVSALGVEG
ncbi:MAG: CIA30 family protein [Planctomycetota bacterium]